MIQQRICIGIIENQQQQVLVGQRKAGAHLQGYWEFPGGKASPYESFKMALRRELSEELGVRVHSALKLIELQHQYEERHLHFQVFKITQFSGRVNSVEAQALKWVSRSQLRRLKFPEANSAMLDALCMPDNYMIADQDVLKDQLFSIVRKQLNAGISLIQYRACNENKATYVDHAKQLKQLCAEFDATLICNCDLAWAIDADAQWSHLNSQRLREVYRQPSQSQPLGYFSASCHNEEEVAMANEIGVRCILIGSVNNTDSHVNSQAIGWSRFSQLCFMANCPVYALGGMSLNDVQTARAHGAQGIAAIRAYIY